MTDKLTNVELMAVEHARGRGRVIPSAEAVRIAENLLKSNPEGWYAVMLLLSPSLSLQVEVALDNIVMRAMQAAYLAAFFREKEDGDCIVELVTLADSDARQKWEFYTNNVPEQKYIPMPKPPNT